MEFIILVISQKTTDNRYSGLQVYEVQQPGLGVEVFIVAEPLRNR
ncbi:MAG: hypothetical protein U7123_19490 [Potamolinea sp.]